MQAKLAISVASLFLHFSQIFASPLKSDDVSKSIVRRDPGWDFAHIPIGYHPGLENELTGQSLEVTRGPNLLQSNASATNYTGGNIDCGGGAFCGLLSYTACRPAVEKFLGKDGTGDKIYNKYSSFTETIVPFMGCAAIFECKDGKYGKGISGKLLQKVAEPLLLKVPFTNKCSKCGAQNIYIDGNQCRLRIDHCLKCRDVVNGEPL